MDLPKHEKLFSQIRLSRYVTACKGDTAKATTLYRCNIQASQALYPLISVLEVGLRNGIDREVSKHFGVQDWLITQRAQFATHPDMYYKDARGQLHNDTFFSDKIFRAEEKLNYRNIKITHGKLLSELTFGFWVKFFDTQSIKILKGCPLQAFVNRPNVKLTAVHSHLHSIANLRNRIAHNEPICFNQSGQLCLTTIGKYESTIMDALGWIDSDLKVWCEGINFFKPVFNRISAL